MIAICEIRILRYCAPGGNLVKYNLNFEQEKKKNEPASQP